MSSLLESILDPERRADVARWDASASMDLLRQLEEQAARLRLLLQVAHGEPVTDEMRLKANVIVARAAKAHADTHADAVED